jgi:hypothetical protein
MGRNNDKLSLTLESNFQPSLHVDSGLIRQADDVFEKEQAGVAEHAIVENAEEKVEMYVNENGYVFEVLVRCRHTQSMASATGS